MEGFIEAGKKTATLLDDSLVVTSDPNNDPKFVALLKKLQTLHGELLKQNLSENPALIGDYLGELRLGANQLFAYLNVFIDMHSEMLAEYAQERQKLYEFWLTTPKGSPSSAESYAREKTRIQDTNIKIIENRIQQIKNNYERYNGICIYLQSRLKEFNTERMVG